MSKIEIFSMPSGWQNLRLKQKAFLDDGLPILLTFRESNDALMLIKSMAEALALADEELFRLRRDDVDYQSTPATRVLRKFKEWK